jgi:hypothetical protein
MWTVPTVVYHYDCVQASSGVNEVRIDHSLGTVRSP